MFILRISGRFFLLVVAIVLGWVLQITTLVYAPEAYVKIQAFSRWIAGKAYPLVEQLSPSEQFAGVFGLVFSDKVFTNLVFLMIVYVTFYTFSYPLRIRK